MATLTKPNLTGVAETLLLPLYIRARESQRPDAIVKDQTVVDLISRLDYDFSSFKFDKEDEVAIILRVRQFDRYARDFLTRHPNAVVAHLGCGLDSRFERVDNGLLEWYDLDLPEVIDLRRQLLGGERPRYHQLGCSLFEQPWLDHLSAWQPRPFLFLAEGVFMYFDEAQVRSLLLSLCGRFPGAELVFDGFSRLIVWANNRLLNRARIQARYSFAISNGKDLESWGGGLRMLDEWRFFDCDEPRLAHVRWASHIPPLAKSSGVFHYRLGKSFPPA
jgi:O-methyltransferase involved in polyketide biosynthesis